MEEFEKDDWQIDNTTPNHIRKEKSISSYYLTQWIDKVRDITFPTCVYTIDECPEQLPFDECMVRYEHKSPSDSEYWGPVNTKTAALNLFYTSLVCRRGRPGKYICVRKYAHDLGLELRCFWNTRLVAVGVQSFDDHPLSEDYCRNMMNYLHEISNKIPFHRCVLDIAECTNGFILIEFNSWETNSGASPYSWIDDTDILYPLNGESRVYFKWNSGYRILNDSKVTKLPIPGDQQLSNLDEIALKKPNKPSNWLVTNHYIYITTDIWIGYFDHKLSPLGWRRGVYRFGHIMLCTNGYIYAGGEYFTPYLKPVPGQFQLNIDIYKEGNDYEDHHLYRYGFHALLNHQSIFCRLLNDGSFWIVKDIEKIDNK